MSAEKIFDEIKKYDADRVIEKIEKIVKKFSKNEFHVETDGILQSGATTLKTLKIKYQKRVIASYQIVASCKEGEELDGDWIAGAEQIPSDLAATIKHFFEETFLVKDI